MFNVLKSLHNYHFYSRLSNYLPHRLLHLSSLNMQVTTAIWFYKEGPLKKIFFFFKHKDYIKMLTIVVVL